MPRRSRAEESAYRQYLQTYKQVDGFCAFCDAATIQDQVIRELEYCYVLQNRFPYSQWDQQAVADHVMIVPKKHVPRLLDVGDAALLEIMKTAAEYEANDYNIYARTPGSHIKSIAHQHTHLIKTVGPASKVLLFTQKPYIRIAK